jgi:hypothetical protein
MTARRTRRKTPEPRFPVPPPRAALPDWYPDLLDAVTDRVQTGRQRAVAAANQELVSTYWAVGAEILARQEAEGWGSRVIDRLAADLRERFPDASGFSPRNLKYMRAFAAAWPDEAIVQRSVAQLPWRHHIALLEKLDDTTCGFGMPRLPSSRAGAPNRRCLNSARTMKPRPKPQRIRTWRSRRYAPCSTRSSRRPRRTTSAVELQGEEVLARIARELVGVMRRDTKTDWTVRDDVRAKLRSSIKRLLVKYRYPPDKRPEAMKLVIEQMEAFAPQYAEQARRNGNGGGP